jgi:hypothetical protein
MRLPIEVAQNKRPRAVQGQFEASSTREYFTPGNHVKFEATKSLGWSCIQAIRTLDPLFGIDVLA